MSDRTLHIRVSDKLYATIREVCDTRGLLLSEACRDAIRKAYPYVIPKDTPEEIPSVAHSDTPGIHSVIPKDTPTGHTKTHKVIRKKAPKATHKTTPTDTPTGKCKACGEILKNDGMALIEHITEAQKNKKYPERAKQHIKTYGKF